MRQEVVGGGTRADPGFSEGGGGGGGGLSHFRCACTHTLAVLCAP